MQRKSKRVIIHEANERVVKHFRKNFMKPKKKDSVTKYGYSKIKNLWITGTKEKLETFIQNAIGNEWVHVYNKDNSDYWDNYYGQPFIVFRLYDKKNRMTMIQNMKRAGEEFYTPVNVRHSSGVLDPELYHCIVLSIYSKEEYCKGTEYEKHDIGGLDWRYDDLKL